MDYSNLPIAGKIPINKVTDFIAGFIPGAAAVYIYYVANPSAFHLFLASGFLGYRTKLCLGAGFCLVVGNTLTLFVNVLGGTLWGGYWGARNNYLAAKALKLQMRAQQQQQEQPQQAQQPQQPPQQQPQEQAQQQQPQQQPPWREATWRSLAAKYLKDNAPDNTMPMTEDEFNSQLAEIRKLTEGEQRVKGQELGRWQQKLLADEAAWKLWYSYLDDELRRLRSNDFSYALADGIRKNLQATGVYAIGSLLVVPALRNWMFITFALAWVWITFSMAYVTYLGAINPWTTWSAQLEFLAEKTLRREKAEKAG
jgi:hypothetical protein